jgi:hypothetical protein
MSESFVEEGVEVQEARIGRMVSRSSVVVQILLPNHSPYFKPVIKLNLKCSSPIPYPLAQVRTVGAPFL